MNSGMYNDEYSARGMAKGFSYNYPAVSRQFLAFPFHHIDGEQIVSFCCELSLRFPHVRLCADGEQTIEAWRHMRARLIEEGSPESTAGSGISRACAKCPQYHLAKWKNDDRIQMVHLSMSPAPCQSRCFYCEVIRMESDPDSPKIRESYERVFDALDYADRSGMISPAAEWLVSSGEISIHPYKDRIMEIVHGKRTTFFTNAFLFDEKIGRELSENPGARINLSIDSGTPETWRRIKGVGNFSKVMENLRQYRQKSSGGGGGGGRSP